MAKNICDDVNDVNDDDDDDDDDGALSVPEWAKPGLDL